MGRRVRGGAGGGYLLGRQGRPRDRLGDGVPDIFRLPSQVDTDNVMLGRLDQSDHFEVETVFLDPGLAEMLGIMRLTIAPKKSNSGKDA